MPVRILIADDENHICLELEYILGKEQGIEIVAMCSTGDEALEAICKLKPDIVFLDISMPGLDGIKLGYYLKNIKNPPYIIYLTAYDKYAIEAIKVGAKGYILKPFSEQEIMEQLQAAIESLSEISGESVSPAHIKSTSQTMARISGRLDNKLILINQQDLVIAYAKNRSVFLNANGRDYVSNFSLTELSTKLDPSLFFYCHRNYIVNIYKIKEVTQWFNGTYLLIMNDDKKTEVPVSRTKVKILKKLISI